MQEENTPLHLAATWGRLECVKWLVNHAGADFKLENEACEQCELHGVFARNQEIIRTGDASAGRGHPLGVC